MHLSDTKTTDGRWSRSASTSDLPTIAFFRASTLLRRSGPVPGILAAHWPGAIMDKSGLRFVVHFQLIEQPRKLTKKTQNYNLELSSQRGQASTPSDGSHGATKPLSPVSGGVTYLQR